MVRIGAHECQAVRILDADGTPLTTAEARAIGEPGEIALADVEDPGALIDYFFGRGERLVVIELDGATQEGLLDTKWLTANRVWWVQMARNLTPVFDPSEQSRLTRVAPL